MDKKAIGALISVAPSYLSSSSSSSATSSSSSSATSFRLQRIVDRAYNFIDPRVNPSSSFYTY
jgi:hypothetical protein